MDNIILARPELLATLALVACFDLEYERLTFQDPMNAYVGFHPEVKYTPEEMEILETASDINNEAVDEEIARFLTSRVPFE